MALSLTLPKLAHKKIPGKNRIRKIREKSGFEIPAIFDQILRMEYLKYSFMVKLGSFFAILLILTFSKSRFVGSNVRILEKVCQICISHKILIDISQS